MKLIQALAALFALAACSFAQHSSSGSGHAAVSRQAPVPRVQSAAPATSGTHIVPPSPGVAYPATGINPSPFSITNPGFATSLGATVSGYSAGRNGYRRYRPTTALPYAYPVFVGGYGDYGYGYSDSGYADNGYQGPYATDPPPGPQVVINQNFVPEHANPVMRDYSGDSSGVQVYDAPGREPLSSSNDEGTDYYLIAFKDHSIYSAFAYWVDGDTLHYVTPQRVHNQVSVALVDRELTEKLNRGRNMQVKLAQ